MRTFLNKPHNIKINFMLINDEYVYKMNLQRTIKK